MKSILVLLAVCFGINIVNAQTDSLIDDSYHTHKGLYFSFTTGPIFGSIIKEFPYNYEPHLVSVFNGTGWSFDIKGGLAIFENIIIHFDVINSIMINPTEQRNFKRSTLSNSDMNFVESTLGTGVTYYLMPINLYASITVGSTYYKFYNTKENTELETGSNISYQYKLGKEWWVSKIGV